MGATVRGVLAVFLVVLCAGGVSETTAFAQSPPAPISYAEFITLDYATRQQRFVAADPATKALIMRSHLSEWLATNRSRLSAGQVALVQEAIAFVTPALYEVPIAPDLETRSQELQARLACGLRQSDIMTAFKPSQPPAPASWFGDLSSWFTTCVLGK